MGDVPVRSIKGRSKVGTTCKHCSTIENFIFKSLPRVLDQFPFGSLLCNEHHHRIRIANKLRKNKYIKVYEEMSSLADINSSTWSCEILVVDNIRSKGFILHPKIRLEIGKLLVHNLKILMRKKDKFIVKLLRVIKQNIKSKMFKMWVYASGLEGHFLNLSENFYSIFTKLHLNFKKSFIQYLIVFVKGILCLKKTVLTIRFYKLIFFIITNFK